LGIDSKIGGVMQKKIIQSLLMVVLSSYTLFASGFSIYEQGAKATSMGGAFIAQANDASAVFYNPAGITEFTGIKLVLGTTIIQPQFSFTGPQSVDPMLYNEAKSQIFTPIHLYTTVPISEKFAFGFGIYNLFGLGSDWGDDWVGKQLATNTSVETFFFNPVVAYKVLDNLSLAAGFNMVYGMVTMEKQVYFSPRNVFGGSKLDATAMGYSWNLALKWNALENLSIGATYRSETLLPFEDGDATFSFAPTGNPIADAEIAAFFPNTKGSADLTLPAVIGAGISYKFSDKLTAEVDYMQMNWSSYDVLTIKFDDAVGGKTETTAEKKYIDSYSIRLGLEYLVNETWAVRAGYVRDNHAVPDERVEPSLPEGDRNLYSLGVGYNTGNFVIDAYYMLLTQEDREITNSVDDFNGTYKGIGNLYGITVGYSF
jgi:long-chain fatty acid transport protein